ncbi:hypothetical protein NVP1152O_085 [Vibrio phage 1.152.O._10N.222.46.E1]|uniref:Uncharacterized protein n=5 Tax=Nahantvirus 49C7 TaxID=2846601 RepID=A0A2I7RBF2_9CAUD|nr:hypothetical protein HYP57_gp101 [Vibrio phage 1.026.O._10N.222.49.C7]AUR82567.1 hypothetical protein NVP1025O_084 [Vibrio phage 1.025.O._10N.222.46.B6]AUR90817.1 hypothetical protein NVP1150O_084 [Vibrio phage 1.150.O._10N.222.46.A6]AUR90990.1 hypothetical protein NVP1152O_085 [Vibrio phage 1.152.O._10N.222.46.E1]AUS02458.1 hypothetical protein NVP2130O_084 [Vibrio phage 2.130.O._10N.222.46.C2]AUR82675.1 hypothetical protein NVP1026O_084 [Vibrio phage 1.026.O._10N.222.49.C7]
MRYELWVDDGDMRYVIKHPVKFMWLDEEPRDLEYELNYWEDTADELCVHEMESLLNV